MENAGILMVATLALILFTPILVEAYREYQNKRYIQLRNLILSLLEDGRLNGPEIMSRSKGALTNDTLYPILLRMDEEGLIQSHRTFIYIRGTQEYVYAYSLAPTGEELVGSFETIAP